jgi:hypothetical protein
MMGREDFLNSKSFITEQNWIISAPCWLFKNKFITMHGNMSVKIQYYVYPYVINVNKQLTSKLPEVSGILGRDAISLDE